MFTVWLLILLTFSKGETNIIGEYNSSTPTTALIYMTGTNEIKIECNNGTTANGTIYNSIAPNIYMQGLVDFPGISNTTHVIRFYPDENKIYWNGERGNAEFEWTKFKAFDIIGTYTNDQKQSFIIESVENNEIRINSKDTGVYFGPIENNQYGYGIINETNSTLIFYFYPDENRIYWNGLRNTTNNTWIKDASNIFGSYGGCGICDATITKTIGNGIQIHWSDTIARPSAYGTYSNNIGIITFPDDTTYVARYYVDENKIYWNGERGNTTNVWISSRWCSITEDNIVSTEKSGVDVTFTDGVAEGRITESGCGNGPESHVYFYIEDIFNYYHSDITSIGECTAVNGQHYNYCSDTGIYYCCGVCHGEALCDSNGGLRYCACNEVEINKWIKVRYTVEFYGSSSCWSILGDTGYGGVHGVNDTFDFGLYTFDTSAGDKIIENNLLYGTWNGEIRACDNEVSNFWHGQHGTGYKGSITVEQRRYIEAHDAAIGSGHSCTAPEISKVVFKDIMVQYQSDVCVTRTNEEIEEPYDHQPVDWTWIVGVDFIIVTLFTAVLSNQRAKQTDGLSWSEAWIKLMAWYLLCGGLVVVIMRVLIAIFACLWCFPDHVGEHLTIAKYAFNPVGRKLILTGKAHPHPKRPGLFNFLAGIFWTPVYIATTLIQVAFTLTTRITTFGKMDPYWGYIWQVHEMRQWIKLVDDNYQPPIPNSKGPYNPNIKCTITLLGHHNKYLCAESNHKMVCNRAAAKEWEIFQSIPVEKNTIGLRSHHGKYVSAQSNGTLQGNRDRLAKCEEFTVQKSGNKWCLKSCHNKWLSAQPDGRIEINRGNLAAWEQFRICVINYIDTSVKCDSGHILKFTTPDGLVKTSPGYKTAYICNGCSKQFEKCGAFHCKWCKYDLCNTCYGNKTSNSKQKAYKTEGIKNHIELDFNKVDEELPGYNNVIPTAPVMDNNENPGDVPPAYEFAPHGEGNGFSPGSINFMSDNNSMNNEVGKWLIGVGDTFYSDYHKLFADNGFDTIDVVKTLTDYDLEIVIGISKVGHRRKLMLEIEKL